MKKKLRIKNFISIIFFLAIGFICGLFIAENILTKENPLFRFILLFISLYVIMFIQIIIHELGHLIFGLLTGYKFVSFRIGSLTLIKINGKIKIKRLSLAGTGGQCLLSPPEMKDGKIPYVLYNLGGSFFNLIMSVIFLLIGICLKNTELLGIIFYISAVIGISYALMNGIPMRVGVVDNDGYNTLSISKNTKAIKSLWTQMKVSELTANGVRLKDMPNEWFIIPSEEEMKNSMIATMGVLAYNRYMDELNFSEAEKLMKMFLKDSFSFTGIYKHLMKCDLAFCEMIKDIPNTEEIESLLDKETKAFMKSMKKYPSVIRTQYTYNLLIKKDIPTALKIKENFNKIAKKYPFKSDIESETELIQIAETKAIMLIDT